MEKKLAGITEEELSQISGGDDFDISKYSEEELAQIFKLYFEMYGHTAALSYLSNWGVTAGDYYIMTNNRFWHDSPYDGAKDYYKLAHLIYMRNHR